MGRNKGECKGCSEYDKMIVDFYIDMLKTRGYQVIIERFRNEVYDIFDDKVFPKAVMYNTE